MNVRRLGFVAVLTALAALTVTLGVAGAHRASFPTEVVIDQGGPDGASGHIVSKRAKCLGGRQVSLYVKDPGTGYLVLVGTATTDSRGAWSIETELFAGEYVAKVDSKKTRIHGKKHPCRPDSSPPKRL